MLLITAGLSGAVGATPTRGGAEAGLADSSAAPLAQETTTQGEEANETANATVTFTDQRTNGSAVVVDEANLSDGGYLAIFAQNGTLLGNSSYLEPGTYENVTVPLNTEINGSQVVIAAPHVDTDGDRQFGFNATSAAEVGAENATDRPYIGPNGLPIGEVAFVITGDAPRRTTTAAANRTTTTA
ncbi:DUF7282 domain-containing protein [Halorussus salinus]|uniref:DUF7282 domain-containing protein n=1 Tax=Halorussus salinus TaxID=1364935 RepID=UPI00138F29D6|nr:hypothetical protein [Halorussus salinus]